jgi:hypothetical protein
VASSAQDGVGEVTGRDAILTTLDGLTKLLNPKPARFKLCAVRWCLEYDLLR